MLSARTGDTVTISYIGTLDDGTVFHRTEDAGPLTVTLGAGEIFPALEEAVVGMRSGETRNIFLTAAQAFGERSRENVITLSREMFPAEKEIKIGQKLGIEFGGKASRVMTVREVCGNQVTLDGNHPLAGCSLTFALRLETIGRKGERC